MRQKPNFGRFQVFVAFQMLFRCFCVKNQYGSSLILFVLDGRTTFNRIVFIITNNYRRYILKTKYHARRHVSAVQLTLLLASFAICFAYTAFISLFTNFNWSISEKNEIGVRRNRIWHLFLHISSFLFCSGV